MLVFITPLVLVSRLHLPLAVILYVLMLRGYHMKKIAMCLRHFALIEKILALRMLEWAEKPMSWLHFCSIYL